MIKEGDIVKLPKVTYRLAIRYKKDGVDFVPAMKNQSGIFGRVERVGGKRRVLVIPLFPFHNLATYFWLEEDLTLATKKKIKENGNESE